MKLSKLSLLTLMLVISSAAPCQTYSFTFDGLVRNYDVHLPPGYTTSSTYPLVLELHGSDASTALTQQYTRMDEVADTANFIVVYPQGIGLEWNNGYGFSSTADDVGFISALIDTMEQNFSIDTSRVYATGGSAGGFMCYRLACEIPWKFAAIASVSGLMANSVRLNCQNSCPMPVLHIHGTTDTFVIYAGTNFYVSVDSTISIWVAKNNCPTTPVTSSIPDTNLGDSCHVTKYFYGSGTNGAETILYKVINGGHTYPGGEFIFTSNGNTNLDMIASVETWNFFKNHTRQCYASGITETSNTQSMEFYPNPASNSITIASSVQTSNTWLTIHNLHGQQVMRLEMDASTTEIDISFLAKGMYFVKVTTEKGTTVMKFIKE